MDCILLLFWVLENLLLATDGNALDVPLKLFVFIDLFASKPQAVKKTLLKQLLRLPTQELRPCMRFSVLTGANWFILIFMIFLS